MVQVVEVIALQDASQTAVVTAREVARAIATAIVRMGVKMDALDVLDALQAVQMDVALHALKVALHHVEDAALATMDNVKILAEKVVKIYVELHVLRNVRIIALLPAEIIAQE